MRKAACVTDYRALAKARLPHFLFEYVDGGSYDEVTLRRNVADLQAIALRQRVLRDVSAIDLSTKLFGNTGQCRSGLARSASPGFMRGAAKCRRPKPRRRRACRSPCRRSAPARSRKWRASGAPAWFQLYFVKDRGFVADMIARAKRGRLRRADPHGRSRRAGIALSRRARGGRRDRPDRAISGAAALAVGRRAERPAAQPRQPRADRRQARAAERLPGVDPRQFRSVRHLERRRVGARAMGRAADHQGHARSRGCAPGGGSGRRRASSFPTTAGASSTACARRAARIAARSPTRLAASITVLVDGGVRSGLDVVRMLALGADFVLLGRAWAYALAAGGGDAELRIC